MASPVVADYVRRIEVDRANWLEDVLAGLLVAGVRQDEIEIQVHPADCKTVVAVRGVPKYEWTFNLTTES